MSFCHCILTYDIFYKESYDTGIPTAMKCQYMRSVVERYVEKRVHQCTFFLKLIYEVALANALILLLSLLHKVFTCLSKLSLQSILTPKIVSKSLISITEPPS